MKLELFLKTISELTSKGMPAGFTGLGIILIDQDIGTLPISPLLSEDGCKQNALDVQEIVNFLFDISNIKDNRHDGFRNILAP
jgi:hypothetical protein